MSAGPLFEGDAVTALALRQERNRAKGRDVCPGAWVRPIFEAAIEAARSGRDVAEAVARTVRRLERKHHEEAA